MHHTISGNIVLADQHSFSLSHSKTSYLNQFISWCDAQEQKRFLWLGISLMGSIGAILPLTLFAIIMGAGNNFSLWVIACIVNVPVLVFNLAVQPTKIILPVVFISWLADAIIIALSFSVLMV